MLESINFIGVGPKDTDPLYGLLDCDHNYFYLVDYRLSMIVQLRQIASGVRQCALIDITSCKNWSPNLIDNSVCSGWGIDQASPIDHGNLSIGEILIEHMDQPNQNQSIQHNLALCRQIIEQLAWVEEKEMSKQKQVNAPSSLVIGDPWIRYALNRELEYFYQKHDSWQEIKYAMASSMLEIAVDREDYPVSLFKLFGQHLSASTDRPINRNSLYVWQ